MTAGTISWARRNLFRSATDAVLSILLIPLTLFGVYSLFHWVFVTADWSVIGSSLHFLMVGTIASAASWRAWAAAGVLAALAGVTLGMLFKLNHTAKAIMFLGLSVLLTAGFVAAGKANLSGIAGCMTAAYGGWIVAASFSRVGRAIGLIWLAGLGLACALLAPAGVNNWGGLLLSVLVTAIATILSLPLGIMLALGRTSRIVSLRIICTGYIEFIRSVPLLSVIYWAWIIVPLILPPNDYVLSLIRGIAGFVLFYAAFVAEYVRAGLQGVPAGQAEAADALGLTAYDKNIHIMLPQAIRTVIPALVGNILDIFNNVPLLFIIGLTDFLQSGETILANPQYGASQFEVYGFLFAVYLVIGGFVSHTARRLEFKLHISHR